MKNNSKRIPAILAQAWVAAACIGPAGAVYGSQMGELGLYSGYRQDSASFSICSTLSDPATFGFGKMRARQVHIWEIGAVANYRFTEDVGLAVNVSWGKVLGGRVRDSGVADINSDPWNAVIGGLYASCCDCSCKPDLCQCTCPDKFPRVLTPVQAGLTGNVWDVDIVLDYSYFLTENFSVTPMIGYAFNQQRYKFRNASWGPVQLALQFAACEDLVKGRQPLKVGEEVDPGIDIAAILIELPWDNDVVGLTSAAPYVVGDADLNILDYQYPLRGSIPECVQIASCFDGTAYRANWNGGVIGLNFGYIVTNDWHLTLQYNFYLQNYSGKFSTFGGDRNSPCDCNQCLSAFVVGKEYLATGKTSPSGADLPRQGFANSEMRFGGWAYGQELALASQWRCNDWVASIVGSVGYRYAPGCKEVSPCASCNFIENGGLRPDGGGDINPVWSDATAQGARWNSFQINANVAYLF